jgi:antitoxin MazE
MGAQAELKVQSWGNNLAVRIPTAVARAARLVSGQPVRVEVVNGAVVVTPQGRPTRTLAQKLRAFDPSAHGGEIMAMRSRVGQEAI